MRENDEITNLFRSRLSQAEMPVRDDSWDKLSKGLAMASRRRHLIWMRVASSAAVLLVLLATSAAFWYLSPKEEMGEAFNHIATTGSGSLIGDQAYQSFSPIPPTPVVSHITPTPPSAMVYYQDMEEDSVMISVSFSFSITSVDEPEYSPYNPHHAYWRASAGETNPYYQSESTAYVAAETSSSTKKEKKWTASVKGGITLPNKSICKKLPFTIGATVERKLNQFLGIETGVQYSHVPTDERNLHYIGVPVKVNAKFVQTPKVDLYASAGGVAEKCISGAPSNNFKNEPIQLAVTAGIGANYKLNDRMALFVEPTVSHHFKTDSKQETTRTGRPTNLNVLCGVRMAF